MTIGIYGIFDSFSGQCLYVGQSKNVEKRWKEHIKKLKSGVHSRSDFIEWFNNRDKDSSAFRFVILEICENEYKVKNALEMKWFLDLQPIFFGKQPALNQKWEHSKSTIEKIRKTAKKNSPIKMYPYECLICKEYFVSRRLKAKFCSPYCSTVSTKSRYYDAEYKNMFSSMYLDDKMSLQEISKKLKISYVTVAKILEHFGIPRRGRCSIT